MRSFKDATKIISTLGLDPLLPAYSAITYALSEKTAGLLCAYGNSLGQLVAPNGVVTAGGTVYTTGSLNLPGSSSGAIIITPLAATAETITITNAAQTVGNVTLTIPNFAGVNDTYAFVTLAQALSNKTFLTGTGYSTGAGGQVTQITTITTGVTLSKAAGQITTVSSTLAAAASAVFTVTNTLVAATDTIIASVGTYAGTGTPVATVKNVVAGAYDIVLQNVHASAALNAAVLINVAQIKSVAS